MTVEVFFFAQVAQCLLLVPMCRVLFWADVSLNSRWSSPFHSLPYFIGKAGKEALFCLSQVVTGESPGKLQMAGCHDGHARHGRSHQVTLTLDSLTSLPHS